MIKMRARKRKIGIALEEEEGRADVASERWRSEREVRSPDAGDVPEARVRFQADHDAVGRHIDVARAVQVQLARG